MYESVRFWVGKGTLSGQSAVGPRSSRTGPRSAEACSCHIFCVWHHIVLGGYRRVGASGAAALA